jgi:hypothetical protein
MGSSLAVINHPGLVRISPPTANSGYVYEIENESFKMSKTGVALAGCECIVTLQDPKTKLSCAVQVNVHFTGKQSGSAVFFQEHGKDSFKIVVSWETNDKMIVTIKPK